MNSDVQDFIRFGIAALIALAWCGWTYHAIAIINGSRVSSASKRDYETTRRRSE